MLRVGGGRLPGPPVVRPGRIGEEASSPASLRGRYATRRGRYGLGGRIAQLRGHWAFQERLRRVTPGLVLLALLGMVLILLSGMEVL